MFSYTLESSKPTTWRVECGGSFGFVMKNEDTSRSKRWILITDPEQNDGGVLEGEKKFFKSRRAAFHFFKTGEKFETKPVYDVRGKGGARRIR